MFGWLFKNEVNDDAVRLKTLADIAASKYCRLSLEDACVAIKGDFSVQLRHTDRSSCLFVFKDLPDFFFNLHLNHLQPGTLDLGAHGEGKYAGFLLQTHDGGARWSCLASGFKRKETDGAKKMAELLEKKFGIINFSESMAQLENKSKRLRLSP